MLSCVNRQIILVNRPKGLPTQADFQLIETSLPEITDNEVSIKTLYLSVDPYMRGRMNDQPSYVTPFQLNQPLTGFVVGQVLESKCSSIPKNAFVTGFCSWADYSVAKGEDLKVIDPELAPLSTALSVLGMTGLTAYFGLLDIGQPQKDETVVVSGAAGAVGTMVGQIAKIKGCYVIGIAGDQTKCDFLTKDLGFDQALNYKDSDFNHHLKIACKKGVDVYFDNVGGDVTDAVMPLINPHARLVICGQISMYNMEKPDIGPRHFRTLLYKRALAKGFIIGLDYSHRFDEGIQQIAQWMKEGKIKHKETITEGLEKAPQAFIGLFKGENLGKQIVKVAEA